MSKIVAVISGKGGSGKTTLAVNLASQLKIFGKKTLLIDCSFQIRNDDIPLGVTTQLLCNLCDVISGDAEFEEAVIRSDEAHIPDFIGSSVSPVPDFFPVRFPRFISKISRHYEYIIIDTPSSSGYEFDASVSCADVVLAVSEPGALSLQNTALCVNRLPSQKEAYLVLNKFSMSDNSLPCIEDIIDEVGIPLIGIIRCDEFVTQSLEKGDPIVRYNTFSGRDIENLSLRLDKKHVDLSKKTHGDRLFDKNKLALKNTLRRVLD